MEESKQPSQPQVQPFQGQGLLLSGSSLERPDKQVQSAVAQNSALLRNLQSGRRPSQNQRPENQTSKTPASVIEETIQNQNSIRRNQVKISNANLPPLPGGPKSGQQAGAQRPRR